MKYPLLLITLLFLLEPTSAEMRYWKKSDGSVFEGEYLRQKLGNAYFMDKDRKTHSIAITDLVVSDAKYLESLVPPKVVIKVKDKVIPEEGEYKDPRKSVAKATITLAKKTNKVFNGTLTAELYLVRSELAEAYPDIYRILAKKTAEFRFPENDKSSNEVEISGVVREFQIKGEERGWAYEGFLVVLLDRNGEVLQTETDLRWLDDEKLEKFRQTPTYQFFNKDCKRESTPRPKFFSNRTM